MPETARALAAAFWPGPLTVVVPRAARVPDAVTGGRPDVGLRVPAHPVALALLAGFSARRPGGAAIAAPSANRFGRVSPTTAAHVRDDLGADVDLILDGGPCQVGVESTIVDCTGDRIEVLRLGGIDLEHLTEVLGRAPGVGLATSTRPESARAPGMLASHYAPRARVVVVEVEADVVGAVSEQVEAMAPSGGLVVVMGAHRAGRSALRRASSSSRWARPRTTPACSTTGCVRPTAWVHRWSWPWPPNRAAWVTPSGIGSGEPRAERARRRATMAWPVVTEPTPSGHEGVSAKGQEAVMSNELSLTTDEIQELAGRLDAWDGLSDRDRDVLGGVFALAGAAVATAQPEDEVTGFALEAGPALGGGTFESFQWGAGQAEDAKGQGKGGAAQGTMFLRFDFKLVAVKTISW